MKRRAWIEGFKGKYKVSAAGYVISMKLKRPLVPELNKCGHLRVDLCKDNVCKKLYVHRLVAIAFIPNPDPNRILVNHKDGKKTNNKVDNLEWATPSENILHYHRELKEIKDEDF